MEHQEAVLRLKLCDEAQRCVGRKHLCWNVKRVLRVHAGRHLEKSQSVRAVTDELVLGLLVVVEHHFVVLPANA